ncbi:hypothetical protein [Luteimonas kalidii]|uniref:Lysozyme inhibitor LprI N-terminal domain-containing protein n=1 Tax=Luteimonas kalidii TaxID=3042025 RepID=A0ABT6JQ21_9GAMM|nr:hypothetical protein [Luteimonas kalidii]MDH5832709.1 hypothetical protein [Luteimonas kalidii]
MKRSVWTAVLAIGVGLSASVASADESVDLSPIVAQQHELREELLESPDSFPGLTRSERGELLDRQAQLFSLFEGKTTAAELGEEERIEAFNSLEWIKSRLADSRGERLVCKRERMVGSQRITRVCRTEAEMTADRERSREYQERAARSPGRDNG